MKKRAKSKPVSKLNPEWVTQTRTYFLEFLRLTKFPHPERNGQRGSKFDYPEWLILLIAVVAVKAKVKTYVGIHRLAKQYWDQLCPESRLSPLSESQLRDRLKKIRHTPRRAASFIFQIFPAAYLD
jgi:hypothetical protein